MEALFKGVAFPYQKGITSFPDKATDADLIKQSIIQILLTTRGERVMRPDFGSGLIERVFDSNNTMLKAMLKAEVNAAVGKWEPRAIVQGVDVQQQESTITVTVSFIVVATQQQDSVSLQLSTPQ